MVFQIFAVTVIVCFVILLSGDWYKSVRNRRRTEMLEKGILPPNFSNQELLTLIEHWCPKSLKVDQVRHEAGWQGTYKDTYVVTFHNVDGELVGKISTHHRNLCPDS